MKRKILLFAIIIVLFSTIIVVTSRNDNFCVPVTFESQKSKGTLSKVFAIGSGEYASAASRLNHQRNLFQAANRFWIFYGSYCEELKKPGPYPLYFSSSSDGILWETPKKLTTFPIADAQWDIRFDGKYLHIIKIIKSGKIFHDGLLYRRGIPKENGTIVWDRKWQIVIPRGNVVNDPCLMITSDGYACVAYGNKGSNRPSEGDAFVIKNAVKNGKWVTSPGFPTNLTKLNDRNHFAIAAKYGSKGIYACVHGWGVAEKLKGYYSADGGSSFISDGEISTLPIKGAPSQYVGTEELVGTADGRIHLVYYSNDDKVIYRQRSLQGTWGDEVQLNSLNDVDTNVTCPRLSIDNNGNIYVTWEGGNNIWCSIFKSGEWCKRVKILDAEIERHTDYTHLMPIEDNFEPKNFQFTELLSGFKLNHYIMDLSEL